jgi:hypothetical protein
MRSLAPPAESVRVETNAVRDVTRPSDSAEAEPWRTVRVTRDWPAHLAKLRRG